MQKFFTPGKVNIVSSARTRANKIPQKLASMPGGLYPLRMALWETDEYRIANGWPIAPPSHEIRVGSLVSSEGLVLSDRESARSVNTGADIRWVSDWETFDETSLTWYPVQIEYGLTWHTAPEYSPTHIDDYEYEIGYEVFQGEGLNFDSDSHEHMWTDLTGFLGGSAGYTMVMCASLNSVYGNNLDIPYSGIRCPGYPTPAIGQPMSDSPRGGWISLTLQGQDLYLETDQTPRVKAMSISHLLESTAPVMIAMVVGRPYTYLYAGRGPSTLVKATIPTGSRVVPLDGHIVMGRTNGDINHTADMLLLDLGIYAESLTSQQVRDEFSTLSSIYGGDR